MMRVAVIGGGVSGLAAAYILAKEGAEVVVYEKEDRLGGQAKTAMVDGIALDLGLMNFSRVRNNGMTAPFSFNYSLKMASSRQSFCLDPTFLYFYEKLYSNLLPHPSDRHL